jgi:hypothetical protein
VHLDLVEARRRRRKAHEPVDANNASPPRRQRERVEQAARTHVLCLYALAGVASPDVLRDVAGFPRPEGEPAYQGRCLVPAEVASERRVVALLENAMSQVAAIGDAEPVGFALAAPIQQTHCIRNTPPAGRAVGGATGWPLLSTMPPTVAAAPLKLSPKKGSFHL